MTLCGRWESPVSGRRPVFRGGRTWLVNPRGGPALRKAKVDATMIGALRKAHQWLADHNASPWADLDVLRTAASPKDSYCRRVVQLGFLAPDIQLALVEGRHPPGFTVQQVLERGAPSAWADQRAVFGFPG